MTTTQPRSGIFRTKSVEQSVADTDEPGTRLRRELGALDLMVFGVSVLIGAGIFSITARTAGDITGPSVAISFVIAAIACGFAGLCYAEFASTVPVAGSAYTYSYATFGEFVAWIIGWDMVLEYALGAAVVAKAWSQYLATFLTQIGIPIESTSVTLGQVPVVGRMQFDWGALAVVAALSVVLALGIKLSSRVSIVITSLKILIVLFVIVVGSTYIKAANYRPFIPPAVPPKASSGGFDQSLLSTLTGSTGSTFGVYGLLAGAALVFFAFIGFDAVSTTAEETRNPQKDLPRGILGSLGIVTVLYVATSLVLVGMVKYTDLASPSASKHRTLATAFELNGANWAATIVALGALAGLTTVVLVLMLGQSRVLFAMSRDGLTPRGLARTSERGAPVRITAIVGVAAAVLATFFPADDLEGMVNFGTLFAFILVAIGTWVLRVKQPDLGRSFRAPALPVIAVLAVISCFWLLLNLEVITWIRFVIWMLIGLVVFFAYSRRHSMLARRERGEEPAPAEPASR